MKLAKILMLGMAFVLFATGLQAQEEKMKKEDWTNSINALNQQQTVYQRQIDSLNKEIAGTKEEGAKVDAENEALWKEMYTLCGTDKAGADEMKKMCSDLETRIAEQAKLSDEALSKKEKLAELEALKNEVNNLKKDKRYALPGIYEKVNDLSSRCDQLISRGKNYTPPKPRHDSYSVVLGDYLWRISGKKDVYSDPFQWMKIYSANRDQIRNPDLIYPAQTFVIPRAQEANEYWVQRGDNLKSISQSVYGSPSDWVKIYNANKSIIGEDSNTIYPHTILIIPK